MAPKKKLPKFKSEDDERKFWSTHDSTDYIDWRKGQVAVFPKLEPSVETISLRLPEAMLKSIKYLAAKWDVPYQSLMKVFLAERLDQEFGKKAG